MTEPLVPNPNMRPPGIKPASTDDYTMKEDDVENISMDNPLHPAYKDTTKRQRAGIKVAGIGGNIERAYDEAVKFNNEYKFGEADSTEDTFRHILLGGLVEGMGEKDPLRKRLFKGFAGKRIDAREGNDPESKIDLVNNKFGRILREAVPNEEEFIEAAKDIALLMRSNDTREIKQDKIKQRYGVDELPINSLDAFQRLRSDEFNELPYEIRQSELVSRYKVDPRDAARILVKDPDPMKSTDDYTKREGGALMAQTGVMPMSKAQDDPTGGGPKAAQGKKQTKKVAKVQRGLARPMTDPRDVAMQEVQQASQQKGTQMPMAQAAKGVTAITVGIGSKPNLMKAEKGEPPMGATKKEVADDQHVMMSEGELVVPANVVRYHGLGTYENMRQEALAGLEMMEDAGQIEYVGDEKTSKTNDGGLLKAQTGVTPLGTAPTAASAQFAGLAASDASKFSYTPLRLNQGIPMYDAQGNIIGYQPNTQPTPTRTTGLGAIFTGDPTSVVAPNVGDYQESVKEDFTKPPEGTGGTTTSAGVGGDTGGGGGFATATPNLTPQQQMQRFDANVEDLVDRIPTAPTAFQQSDFDSYVNVRQPMSEREGIMGKVGGAVDTAAGFILPFTGYQDKKIRESAADKLKNFAFGSKSEYDTLVKTVNLPSLGDTEDDPKLVQKLNDAKKIQFDDDTAKKANEFAAKRDAALAQAKEEMSAPVIFKDKTRVDKFLEGPQKTKEEIAAMKPGSEEAATAEYNRQLEKQRDKEMDRLMNPVFAAEKMASELPGSDTSMMSGSEREEAQRRREDAERRAAEFDAFREREETRRAEDSAGVDRGDFGGTPTASDDKIVCTEMYRQTQLVDWQKAMKVWDIYQRRHLTPEHQVGYHWLFRPYVTGMQSSNILTRLGAFMARKRTQHLKHILTKGKAKDDLFGNVFCKLIHPTVYIAGKIKTFLTKI
jgi:hypothetical protein